MSKDRLAEAVDDAIARRRFKPEPELSPDEPRCSGYSLGRFGPHPDALCQTCARYLQLATGTHRMASPGVTVPTPSGPAVQCSQRIPADGGQ